MPMSSYYERMKAARATHGMMAFCNRDTAMELAREADAEIEGLREKLSYAEAESKNFKECWDAACNDIADLAAANEALQARFDSLQKSYDITREIEFRYTNRWLSAWEKYSKAKDNAEATGVFREFLKEPWTAERISETVQRADAAEAKLAAVRERLTTNQYKGAWVREVLKLLNETT